MDENLISAMEMFFGEMSKEEKCIVSLVPKIREYCKKEDKDYVQVIEILIATLQGIPEMQLFVTEIMGLLNLTFVIGIERGKKIAVMQAFVNAEEKE